MWVLRIEVITSAWAESSPQPLKISLIAIFIDILSETILSGTYYCVFPGIKATKLLTGPITLGMKSHQKTHI